MVWIFEERLNLSRIAAVPQAQRQTCLILNLLAQPDKVTPSVDNPKDRKIALESMQFGQAFPRILQVIWEAYPVKSPFQVSKLNFIDAYHCGTLWPSDVGAFMYVVPSDPEDNYIILFINLVLPMGCVGSPNFFCAFSETLTDVVNALLDTDMPVLAYGAIEKSQAPSHPSHTHARASPVLLVIWMTSPPRCRVGQNSNTESLMARSMHSSGPSHHYWESPKTQ